MNSSKSDPVRRRGGGGGYGYKNKKKMNKAKVFKVKWQSEAAKDFFIILTVFLISVLFIWQVLQSTCIVMSNNNRCCSGLCMFTCLLPFIASLLY